MSSNTNDLGPFPAERNLDALVTEACNGSDAALSELFQLHRDDLLLIAQRELDPGLRAKIGYSDLVQETFFEARQDLAQFHGTTIKEFRSWLRALLHHNVLNQARRYYGTAKRDPKRETRIQGYDSNDELQIADTSVTPGARAVLQEEVESIESAIGRLPETHKEVLKSRLLNDLSFAEIATRTERSEGAVRALFYRAMDHLRQELGGNNGFAV